MGEKQLDFNQPFLSVRRFASTKVSKGEEKRKAASLIPKLPPLPAYKSDLKSGPVTNPGTVPFTWEQSPGKPKNEGKLQNPPNHQLSWNTPKLPPGRNLNVNLQGLSRDSDTNSSIQLNKRNVIHSARNGASKKEIASRGDYSSAREDIKEVCLGSEDADEVFLDAQDTFSRSDSFLNCSFSGLSGVDGSDVGSSGRLSMNPQSQDFMMNIFLPAAVAMASDTPVHVPRKQQVAREQPGLVKKAMYINKRHPLYQYKPRALSNSASNPVGFESEGDESYEPGSPSIKVWALFPWLSLRNSFCLLKDIQGAQMQAVEPTSSSCKQQFNSSHMLRSSKNVSQHAAIVDKEHSGYGCCPSSLPKQKLEPKVKSSQTSRTTFSNEHQKADASIGNRGFLEQSKSYGVHYAANDSRVDDFIPQHKPCTTFRDLLAQDINEGEAESTGSVPEKTVYVDAVHKLRSHGSDTSSSDTKIIPGYSGQLSEGNATGENTEDVKFIDTLDNKELIREMGMEQIPKNIEDSGHGYVTQESILDTHDEESYNNAKTDSVKQWIAQSRDQEKPHGNTPTFLLVPPLLPKSPSESWLCRTLPSLSSKNSAAPLSHGLNNYNKMQASKSLYSNSKSERIVETSTAHCKTTKNSEGLLAPMPE